MARLTAGTRIVESIAAVTISTGQCHMRTQQGKVREMVVESDVLMERCDVMAGLTILP